MDVQKGFYFFFAQGVVATAKAVSTAEAEAHSHAICVARTLKANAGIANDPAGTLCRVRPDDYHQFFLFYFHFALKLGDEIL